VLVAHRAGGHAHRAIVEGADQRVLFDLEVWVSSFLGSPQSRAHPLSGIVVEEHAVRIAAAAAVQDTGSPVRSQCNRRSR
jgi:hypothetical protein